MKHTPGPWKVDPRTPEAIIAPAQEGETLARVFFMYGDKEREQTQKSSNARLIAAAPELLEGLKALANEATGFIEYADQATHGVTNIRVLQGKIDAARAAIAKAEGRDDL
jgi:hypothetical protein